MTSYERQNWIINIENSAAAVESYLGSAVVKSVFERYGAHEIQDLNPSDGRHAVASRPPEQKEKRHADERPAAETDKLPLG